MAHWHCSTRPAAFLWASRRASLRRGNAPARAGDQLAVYRRITEALNNQGEQFGMSRLDKVLENCSIGASDILRSVLESIDLFTQAAGAR